MTQIRLIYRDGSIILFPNDDCMDFDDLIRLYYPSVFNHYDADDVSDMDLI